MEQQAPITFIVNGRTYRLAPGMGDAIRAMPAEDRGQLLKLLEAVREQERLSRAAVDAAAASVLAATAAGSAAGAVASPKPERLGSGDVDALMARLVMEEQRNRKPPIDRGSLYKWSGIFIGILLLLVFML
jgi:thioredoxin-like negative regulator of GroEL